MTEYLKIIFYIVCVNMITLFMQNRIFFNNEYKKTPLNFFKGFFLFTCNTFFTIVLYSKVQGVYLALDLSYILLLEWISMNDVKDKKITNKSNILLLILGLVSLIINEVSYAEIIQRLLIAGSVFALGLIVRIISKKQIGGGDIKMLVSLSVRFNLIELIEIIIISIFTGALYASYLLTVKKKDKSYKFAFGEFIALGAILLII